MYLFILWAVGYTAMLQNLIMTPVSYTSEVQRNQTILCNFSAQWLINNVQVKSRYENLHKSYTLLSFKLTVSTQAKVLTCHCK